MSKSIVRDFNTLRKNPLIRDFTLFRVIFFFIFFFFFFSKPAISMLERDGGLIFLLNVFNVGGGVQSHQAIFSLLLFVSTVDLWELTR